MSQTNDAIGDRLDTPGQHVEILPRACARKGGLWRVRVRHERGPADMEPLLGSDVSTSSLGRTEETE
jgi:hypothetical protein